MLKRVFFLCVVFVFSWLLSSCLVPENFKVNVVIHKDGTYTFTYEGLLTHAMIREAYVRKELSAKDEAEIKKSEKEFSEDPSYKKATYLGGGQFKVAYEKKGKTAAPFYFTSRDNKFFSIRQVKDKSGGNLVEIKGFTAGEKEIGELKEIGININGELNVETDGRVIKHNAQGTPRFFGLLSGYKWNIKSTTDPAPYMLVNLE